MSEKMPSKTESIKEVHEREAEAAYVVRFKEAMRTLDKATKLESVFVK